MNRFLSFNPDFFEPESEFEGSFQASGRTRGRIDQNTDFEYGRARGHPAPAGSEWETGGLVRSQRRTPWYRASPLVAVPSIAAPFDSKTLRQRIVSLANQELVRWGNGKIKELDPRTRRALQDYWSTGAGIRYWENQLADPAFQRDHPWSAAFISWIMKTAGAGNAFKYSSSHATYIRAAKDNCVANNDNPFKAYRISEVVPRIGDVVCKSRSGSGATYDNIRPGMKTHCDIVTGVRPGNIVTVGGNVNNSVAQKVVRTDTDGRIMAADCFAVIRVGEAPPSVQVAPSRLQVGVVPTLAKQESMPAGATLYVEIDLEIVDRFGSSAPPITGIFIPERYAATANVDLILYLHGFKAEAIRRQAIDQYWNSKRFPYGALREGVGASGRNVILVAPTLGARSEAKRLLEPGGLDSYIGQVLAALRAYGPYRNAGYSPALGNLIFACHSGGGWPMRQLAGGKDRVLARVRECWGFDCTYNRGDDAFWAGWAGARPNARVYIYYISRSKTAPLAESLRNKRVPNVVVQPSKEARHNYVPITYLQERLRGAPFLTARPGAAIGPSPRGAALEAEIRTRRRPLRTRHIPTFTDVPGYRLADFEKLTAGTGGIRSIRKGADPAGRFAIVIEGELRDPIKRVDASNYNRSRKLLKAEGPGIHPKDWQQSHLWGPGFGDEAAAGIMNAPTTINQLFQNRGVEGWMRELYKQVKAVDGTVSVRATAVAWEFPTSRGWRPTSGADFLRRAEYRVLVQIPGRYHQPATITIDTQEPPSAGKPRVAIDPPWAANPADLLVTLRV